MKHWIFFSLLAFMFINARAQEAIDSISVLIKVETSDGNTIVGSLVLENDEQLILRTSNFGDITINKKIIVRRTPIEAKKGIINLPWFENPHSTTYFFAPNGYGLKTGEAYYQNIWVLFNQISVGINDYFSIGVGSIPILLFSEGAETPVWVTPKVSIPIKKDKINIGVGAMVGTLFGKEDEKTAALFYAVTTFGSKDKNFTIGLGYGYGQYGWVNPPTITLSGLVRISKNVYIISDNYYIGDDGEGITLLLFGIRGAGKTMAFDFAAVKPRGESILIPWLGVNIPFGRTPRN